MTVLSGILDVVTFVNYNVFATKQTGESDSMRHHQHSDRTKHRRRQLPVPRGVHCQQQEFEIQDRGKCRGVLGVVRIIPPSAAKSPVKLTSEQLLYRQLRMRSSCAPPLRKAPCMAYFFNARSSHLDTRSRLFAMGHSAREGHQCIISGHRSLASFCSIRTEQHGDNCRLGRAEHVNGDRRHREYSLTTSSALLSANTAVKVSTLNDPRIFDADNPARNRRVFFVASYAAGCIIGATMTFGTVGSLLLVCAIKLAISVSFLLNRGKATSRFPAVATTGVEHYELDTPVVKASWSD